MFGDKHFSNDINEAEKALMGYLEKLEKTGKLPNFISKKKSSVMVYAFLEGFETGWNFRKKSLKDFRVNEACKIIKTDWDSLAQINNFGTIIGYLMESLRERYSPDREAEFNQYLEILRSGPFFKMVRIALEEAQSRQPA